MSAAETGGAQAPLTFKAAREIVRGLGLRLTSTGWGDFRLTDPSLPTAEREESAYYASDYQEAVDTARAWRAWMAAT